MANKIGGGRSRKSAGAGGNGRALSVADNRTPEQIAEERRKEIDAIHEAEAIQLLSAVSLGKKALIAVDAAKAVLKEKQDAFNDVARNAKTAIKITRKEFVDLIGDSNSSRKDLSDAEAKRVRWRTAMGLPVGLSGEQLELDSRLPNVERDIQMWRGQGYQDGVTGSPHNPPKECIEQGHGNVYDEAYKGGQAALNAANQAAKRARQPAPAAPKPNSLDDPASPESLKANAESEKRARESLEAMGKGTEAATGGEETVAGAAGADAVSGGAAADGFEATAEELAAQAGRPSVVAAKTAEEIAAEGTGKEAEPEAVG